MNELTIGCNLRRLRFEHGEMSQATLAKIVGVTRQTIVALETTRYAPSLELAMKLATVFDVGVDDLFHWVDAEAARARYAQGDKEHG
jgi:putative transcriptional regulator